MKTFNMNDAAKIVGCSPTTIRAWIDRGDMIPINTISTGGATYHELSFAEVMRVKRLKDGGAMRRGAPAVKYRAPDDLLTVTRLARIARRNPGTVYNAVKRGDLKAKKMARPDGVIGPKHLTIIHRSSAKAWLAKRGIVGVEL